MARDYAKRTTSRKPKSSPLPGWLWLAVGLLVGLFIAFLVYLQGQGKNPLAGISLPQPKGTSTDARAVKKEPVPKAPKKEGGINFDFYSILPEQEVVIPESELGNTPTPNAEKANYYLQVGSFKSEEDAGSRMAELFLLNLAPTVQKVTIDGGNTWHRVRVGPYTDRRKLDQARRKLQDNAIDFFIVKEKQG
ncbi:MAG: SPOR domain-containing protein [Chromatiales bacterium]|nr:SPOR domain-containing protein [Chromatiales bacterium]